MALAKLCACGRRNHPLAVRCPDCGGDLLLTPARDDGGPGDPDGPIPADVEVELADPAAELFPELRRGYPEAAPAGGGTETAGPAAPEDSPVTEDSSVSEAAPVREAPPDAPGGRASASGESSAWDALGGAASPPGAADGGDFGGQGGSGGAARHGGPDGYGGAAGSGGVREDSGGGPGTPLLDSPPGPDTPVKVCSRGHVNPPGAWLCLDPDCGEDISSRDAVPFGTLGAGPAGSRGGPDGMRAAAPAPAGASGTWPGAPSPAGREPRTDEDEPLIIYPEEEQLLLSVDGAGAFAVRDGDYVGRMARGSEILERWPTVSRRHLKVSFREGRWSVKNLSTNGTYVNGRLLEVDAESEVAPGDELRLSTRVALKVSP